MQGWGLGEGQRRLPRSDTELSLERVGLSSHRHSRLREHEARQSLGHLKNCKQFIIAGMEEAAMCADRLEK